MKTLERYVRTWGGYPRISLLERYRAWCGRFGAQEHVTEIEGILERRYAELGARLAGYCSLPGQIGHLPETGITTVFLEGVPVSIRKLNPMRVELRYLGAEVLFHRDDCTLDALDLLLEYKELH